MLVEMVSVKSGFPDTVVGEKDVVSLEDWQNVYNVIAHAVINNYHTVKSMRVIASEIGFVPVNPSFSAKNSGFRLYVSSHCCEVFLYPYVVDSRVITSGEEGLSTYPFNTLQVNLEKDSTDYDFPYFVSVGDMGGLFIYRFFENIEEAEQEFKEIIGWESITIEKLLEKGFMRN